MATDFNFDYGIIVYKHRFSVNTSLDDYKSTVIYKVIRIGVELKYTTMEKSKLKYEMQIVYKDNNDNLECLKLDLEDYTVEILNTGDAYIHI